ncbi:MAG: hypothetical protein ACKPGK_08385, partial [Verrucomicrobiota bacterium]
MTGPVSRTLVALTVGIRLIGDGSDAPTPSPQGLAAVRDRALPGLVHRKGTLLPGARLPGGIVAEVVADAPLVNRPMG